MSTLFASRYRSSFILLALLTPLLSSCLTVGGKEYHIALRPDHSGEATIRFINIVSETDDSLDVSRDDFAQLIELYLNGDQPEKNNPGVKNVHKRLYEENGVLVGELQFTFDSLASVRIFQFSQGSPYMYFVGNPLSTEQLVRTNGSYGPDWMPVVFWPPDATDLYVKTRVVSEARRQTSLLPFYREWAASQPSPQ